MSEGVFCKRCLLHYPEAEGRYRRVRQSNGVVVRQFICAKCSAERERMLADR